MENTNFRSPETISESNLPSTNQEVLERFNESVRGPIKKQLVDVKNWLIARPRGFAEATREVDRFFRNLNSELSVPRSAILEQSLPPETQVLAEGLEVRPLATLNAEEVPDQNKDFEPFVQAEEPQRFYPPRKHRFINNYGGPYAIKMELNRTAVERFIQLSRLEGNITLFSLPYSRTRGYLEINPDATVSAKKGLTNGEKNFEEEENPYYRVIATGDGWAVQINGQRILQEINDKPNKKVKDQDRFSKEFNRFLRHALSECVIKEKLTSAKDMFFYDKLFTTLVQPAIAAVFSSVSHSGSIEEFVSDLGYRMVITVPMVYGLVDFMKRKINPAYLETNPRQGVGVFLPPVRIEDVIVGKGYLDFKGRTMVRSQKERKEK